MDLDTMESRSPRRNTLTDVLVGMLVAQELEESLTKLPGGSWRYRPYDFDDWGTVRHVDGDGKHLGFIANARSGYSDEEAVAKARFDGTDPFEAVGRHIELCQPQEMVHLLGFVRHLQDEVERLSHVEDQHETLKDWIASNTDYDPDLNVTDCTPRMVAALARLKEKADAGSNRRLR